MLSVWGWVEGSRGEVGEWEDGFFRGCWVGGWQALFRGWGNNRHPPGWGGIRGGCAGGLVVAAGGRWSLCWLVWLPGHPCLSPLLSSSVSNVHTNTIWPRTTSYPSARICLPLGITWFLIWCYRYILKMITATSSSTMILQHIVRKSSMMHHHERPWS